MMIILMPIIFSIVWCFTVTLVDDFNSFRLVVNIFIVFVLIFRFFIVKSFKIDFFNIIILAFFYLIYFDITIYENKFDLQTELHASKLIFMSFIVLLSCLLFNKKSYRRKFYNFDLTNNCNSRIKVHLYLFFILLLYLLVMIPNAIVAIYFGRNAIYLFSVTSDYLVYVNSLSFVIPGVAGILYKTKKINIYVLLFTVAPIFLIQIVMGTRFIFLFSFFILITFLFEIKTIKLKSILYILMPLLLISVFMGSIRSGLDGKDITKIDYSQRFGHSEGLKYYFSGILEYHKLNDINYLPKHSIFSTYFFIPRFIWEDKPKMLGRYLIDSGVYDENYSQGHSGSVTFFGPFYSDFGKFGLFFIFIISYALKKIEFFYFNNVGIPSYKGLIAAAILPTIFFSIRSLNTSLITFITIVIVSYILFKLLINGKRHVNE